MATYDELMEGARQASAAGDAASAKRFLELAARQPLAETLGSAPGFTPERRAAIEAAITRGEQANPNQNAAPAWQSVPQVNGGGNAASGMPAAFADKAWSEHAAGLTSQGKAIQVELPGGAIVEFPAGTDQATMRAAIERYFAETAAPKWQSAPLVGNAPAWQSAPEVEQPTAGNLSLEQKKALALARARLKLQGQAKSQPAATIAPAPSAAIADELWQQGPVGARYLEPRPSASASLSAAFRDAIKPRDAGALHSGFAGALQGATFNFGDEAMARILSLHPQIDYDEALPFIRKDMERAREQHPTANLAGTIAGAVAMPGKTAANFINKGVGAGARMARGAVAGGITGGIAGTGDGETADQRVTGALGGAAEGALGGWAVTGLGRGFNRVLAAFQKRPEAAELMPSLAGLRDTADDLYRQVQSSTASLSEGGMKGLAAKTAAKLRTEGFDRQLHPRVAAVLDRLQGEAGPKSLAEVEILRRVAGHAASSLQPDERRLAMEVIDLIDDTVDGMDGVAGAARAAWAKMRRMGRVEEAIAKAALQDNFAAGLRNQFKVMLRNPKTMRGFNAAETAAIRDVAKGTPAVNALRAIGAAFSPHSLSGWGATGAAVYGGAGIGAAGIPLAGAGAKKIADMLTSRLAERARVAVGQNEATRAIVEALMRKTNPLARAAPLPGLMGSYLGMNR